MPRKRAAAKPTNRARNEQGLHGRPRRRKRGPSPPTHYLKMKVNDPDKKGWATVGAAWDRDGDGTLLSIKPRVGVVIDWRDIAELGYSLILVPADDDEEIPF